MKFLKVIIPVVIILSILFIDHYNKFYKDNTNFNDESIFLYIVSNDSLSFTDSISKYIKSEKTFYKVAQRLGYLDNIKTGRFKINKGVGNKELISSLKFNNTPLTITFNNQERVENLAGRIAKQIYSDSTALINSFTDKDFLEENNFNKENILTKFSNFANSKTLNSFCTRILLTTTASIAKGICKYKNKNAPIGIAL